MDDSPLPLPTVASVVHYRGRAHYQTGFSRHVDHVIACHLQAVGSYVLGQEEVVADPPYLVLLAAGEDQGNRLVGETDAHWCKFAWPGISGAGARVRLTLAGTRFERSHTRRLSAAERGRAVDLFRDLRRLAGRPAIVDCVAAGARVLDLLALWAAGSVGADEDAAVEAYRELIERHACDDAVALTEIARRLERDPDHLGARFRRVHGATPIEYRTRARLLRGRDALADGASVAAAAHSAGFPDPRYFARLFRRRYGTTPTAFARSSRHG